MKKKLSLMLICVSMLLNVFAGVGVCAAGKWSAIDKNITVD